MSPAYPGNRPRTGLRLPFPAKEVSPGQGAGIWRDGFSFTPSDTSWGVVSDPADASAPLEFFNAQTNSRAVIQLITLKREAPRRDGPRSHGNAEPRKLRQKSRLRGSLPKSAFGLTGALWEAGGEGDNAPYRACGFVAGGWQPGVYLSLSKADIFRRAQSVFRGMGKVLCRVHGGFQADAKSAEADVPEGAGLALCLVRARLSLGCTGHGLVPVGRGDRSEQRSGPSACE